MDANGELKAVLTSQEVLAESKESDSGWLHSCDTYLLGAKVVHSVHEMPHALAGSGQVETQVVAYCPLCHEKPSPYGAPITPSTTEWPKVLVRRKAPANGRTDG